MLPTDFGSEVAVEALVCFADGLFGAGADLAMGRDKPLNFPRLATPTPQVNCVLYPEHSVPNSRHCEQYGRRRSHLVLLLLQAKQSSDAPLAGARLRRFRGAEEEMSTDAPGHGTGTVILNEQELWMLLNNEAALTCLLPDPKS